MSVRFYATEEEAEVDRNSRDYVLWVQQSLNRVSGLRLAVDGIAGPATCSAVRSFQQQRGLTVDGIVGPQTQAALVAALGGMESAPPGTPAPTPASPAVGSPAAVLDRFALESERLQPTHGPVIDALARRIVASQGTSRPVRAVTIVGYTDPSGSESYNLALGRRRAEQVAQRLRSTMEQLRPGLTGTMAITVDSRGEADSLGGDPALSRRVAVYAPAAGAPTRPATSLNPARWTSIMGSPDLRTGNFVDFIIDGAATFRAMEDAILTATNSEHYIYLLGWWLSDDFPLRSVTLRDLFARASAAGVQIRSMLWDQFGTKNTAEVGRINALPTGAAILDDQTFSAFGPVNVGSHHQKVLLVRGSHGLVAFCGGIDINPDRVAGGGASGGGSGTGGAVSSSSGGSSGRGNPMHDVHCRIVGPAAHDLLTTFVRRWDAHPGHTAIDRGPKGNLRGRSEPRPAPLGPRPSTGTGGICSVRIARTYTPVAGSTAIRERSIRHTLIAAIQNARRFIYMEDQYLVNMEAATLLNAALSRLQHVTILIPDSTITDMPRIWEGRLNFINRLTAGPHGHKARVFFLATPPNAPGTTPVFGPHTYVHSKTWVFDDELAVIGSANCNLRGWTHDSEVNAVVFEDRNPAGTTFAQRMRMQLWAEHLNVPAGSVSDGVLSARLWSAPPATARIRPYNPRAATDSWASRQIPWTVIDPTGGP